jgi:hypothetical protein
MLFYSYLSRLGELGKKQKANADQMGLPLVLPPIQMDKGKYTPANLLVAQPERSKTNTFCV